MYIFIQVLRHSHVAVHKHMYMFMFIDFFNSSCIIYICMCVVKCEYMQTNVYIGICDNIYICVYIYTHVNIHSDCCSQETEATGRTGCSHCLARSRTSV